MRYYSAHEFPEGWRYTGHCHDHFHATESEARACRQDAYRANVRLDEDRRCSWTSCAIRDCKNPAQRLADVVGDPYSIAPLCDAHWTREDAIKALDLDEPEAGDRWVS